MHQYVAEGENNASDLELQELNIQKTELRPWHFFRGRH